MRAPALRSAPFRRLLLGQLASLTGTQMGHVALVWQLYERTHSPVALGSLALVRMVPLLVFGLYGGVVADAFDRRRTRMLAQGLMALCALMLLGATLTGHDTAPVLYALSFLSSLGSTLDAPARQALLVQLVPSEHLGNAVSLHTLAWQVGCVAGPALGGVLLASCGPASVHAIDAVSYAAILAAVVRLQPGPPPDRRARVSLRAMGEAFAFLRARPLLWSSMLLDFSATFFAGSTLLLPVFASEVLHVGPRELGWLFAAQPVGAMLTAALMAVRGGVRTSGPLLLATVALHGLAVAAFGLSRWLPVSLLFLALAGAADTVSVLIRQTLRQRETPDELRGRMTAVNMLFIRGGPQLGELEAGLVAGWAGPQVSVVSGGVLCVAAVLLLGARVPALRRVGVSL